MNAAEKKKLKLKVMAFGVGIALTLASYLLPRAATTISGAGASIATDSNEIALIGFALCGLVLFSIGIDIWRGRQ
jgi:hypothetical protein